MMLVAAGTSFLGVPFSWNATLGASWCEKVVFDALRRPFRRMHFYDGKTHFGDIEGSIFRVRKS